VGRIPEGGTVERGAPSVEPTGRMRLQLRNADFTNSARIAEVINQKFGSQPLIAQAENAGAVAVDIPANWKNRVTEFIAAVEDLKVDVDSAAKIVVNERTGTIVIGKDVRISPVAILHGNLSVEIQTTYQVSQPLPGSMGTTQVVPQQSVATNSPPAKSVVLQQGATVDELVRALTAIGSTPRDVIAILQNLRAAGALDAELEVI
jgi:flagellar P-ring protein precursor FlgI